MPQGADGAQGEAAAGGLDGIDAPVGAEAMAINVRRLQQGNNRQPGFCTRMQQHIRVAGHLLWLFVLAGHHDWIEPRLRQYDNQHAEDTRIQEAANQLLRLRQNL